VQVYHVVTARAVAEMRVLAELCLPLARVDGFVVAYKVGKPQPPPVEERLKLGGELVNIIIIIIMCESG
jgi:16S rRNA (guanine527-N7)-methyltransferase